MPLLAAICCVVTVTIMKSTLGSSERNLIWPETYSTALQWVECTDYLFSDYLHGTIATKGNQESYKGQKQNIVSLSLFLLLSLSLLVYLSQYICISMCACLHTVFLTILPPVLFYLVSNKHKAGLQGHNVFQQLLKWVQLGRPCYHLKDNWRLIGWLRLIWGRPSLCFRLLPSLCAQSKLSLVAVLSMTGSK